MSPLQRPSVLARFPVVLELPILWGDMDAFGHVNNVTYLKWFEAARAQYAMEVGVAVTPRAEGVGAVVGSITCRYLRQVNYPGSIAVGVRVARMSIGSVTLEFLIALTSTGIPVAEGSCEVVLYDYARERPVPIPESIRTAVERLEQTTF